MSGTTPIGAAAAVAAGQPMLASTRPAPQHFAKCSPKGASATCSSPFAWSSSGLLLVRQQLGRTNSVIGYLITDVSGPSQSRTLGNTLTLVTPSGGAPRRSLVGGESCE